MQALAILLAFAGYTFVYAATAKQGKFATDPLAALLFDAYES